MFVAAKLQMSGSATARKSIYHHGFFGRHSCIRPRNFLRPLLCRAPPSTRSVHESGVSSPSASSQLPLYSLASEPSISSRLTSSVGLPPFQLSQCKLTQRHIVLLNVIACAAAVSATWLFLAAIPALLAFKRAAKSLEKLMDVTREELPDTMAAIRLSGMEISDLTMELSDLGQDITQGVRSSTRAVRLAEEKLRQLTSTVPAFTQEAVYQNKTEETRKGPAVARTARNLREGIVKGRALWQLFLTLTGFSKIAFKYLAKRARQ